MYMFILSAKDGWETKQQEWRIFTEDRSFSTYTIFSKKTDISYPLICKFFEKFGEVLNEWSPGELKGKWLLFRASSTSFSIYLVTFPQHNIRYHGEKVNIV